MFTKYSFLIAFICFSFIKAAKSPEETDFIKSIIKTQYNHEINEMIHAWKHKSKFFFNNVTSIDNVIARYGNYKELLITTKNALALALKKDKPFMDRNELEFVQEKSEAAKIIANALYESVSDHKDEILLITLTNCLEKFSQDDCLKFNTFIDEEFEDICDLFDEFTNSK